MNFKEYTEKAITTSVHDSREKALSCFLFGLLGEWAEYEEKVEIEEKDELIKKELGDFAWYLANISHLLEITPIKVYYDPYATNPFHLIASFQEYMKKMYRDKDWIFLEEDRAKAERFLNHLYSMLEFYCISRNFNLSDVLALNIEKLFSRKERNKINGSGDER